MANVIEEKSESIPSKTTLEHNSEPPSIQTIQEQQNQQQESNVENKQIKPAVKKPPDILCNCPQKCDQRVPQDVRSSLYKEFCSLGDHVRQNAYLQSYIEMRSVYKRLWCQEERIGGRLQRRVSCKYRVPIEVPKPSLDTAAEQPPSSPKLTTNSKGQATIIVGIREGCRTIEVCQKAFMNVYGITEKRIRLQREKLIARLRGDNPDRHFRAGTIRAGSDETMIYSKSNSIISQSNQSNQTSSSTGVHGDDDELSIVDTFFRNQLWKPEYIGIPSDKLQYLDVYYNNVKA
uniref:Uncharacterized protein n=1 Tax=Panstrongylus lignarius TaxID=156445 RepID=A0A224XUY9_9HEMI